MVKSLPLFFVAFLCGFGSVISLGISGNLCYVGFCNGQYIDAKIRAAIILALVSTSTALVLAMGSLTWNWLKPGQHDQTVKFVLLVTCALIVCVSLASTCTYIAALAIFQVAGFILFSGNYFAFFVTATVVEFFVFVLLVLMLVALACIRKVHENI